MKLSTCIAVQIVSALLLDSARPVASKDAQKNNIRSRRRAQTKDDLGRFENVKEPTWIQFEYASNVQERYAAMGRAGALEDHKAWRDSKYPLKITQGVQDIFEEGAIQEIGTGSAIDDNDRAISINPHLVCEKDEGDVETAMLTMLDSMVTNDSSNLRVFLDLEDTSLGDMTFSCMSKLKTVHGSISTSQYPVQADKIVAYPVPTGLTSAWVATLEWSGMDTEITSVLHTTDEFMAVASDLGFMIDEVNAGGGPATFLKGQKRKNVMREI